MSLFELTAFFAGMFVLMKGAIIFSHKIGRGVVLLLLVLLLTLIVGLICSSFNIINVSKDNQMLMLVGCGLLASIVVGFGHGLKVKKEKKEKIEN